MSNRTLCTANCNNNECSALKFRARFRTHEVRKNIVFIVESEQRIFDAITPQGRYPSSDEILDKAETLADRLLNYYGF